MSRISTPVRLVLNPKTSGPSTERSAVVDSTGNTFTVDYKYVDVAGTLYFNVPRDGIWKTNGTAAGTVKVITTRNRCNLAAAGDRIFFDTQSTSVFSPTIYTLWSSDGTAAGTVAVATFPNIIAQTSTLVGNGSRIYFEVDDGVHGHELWKSDGTSAGTVMVKDIRTGPTGSVVRQDENAVSQVGMNWVNLGGILYFIADDGTNGEELWRSDGTTAGTYLVKDIAAGSASSSPRYLTVLGDKLVFTATVTGSGRELWVSDGTAAGTVLVKDIFPGNTGSEPAYLTAIHDAIYFSANDGVAGYELWKTDGTAAGTRLVGDLCPGPCSSDPSEFTLINGTMYFTADNGVTGFEPWKLDLVPVQNAVPVIVALGASPDPVTRPGQVTLSAEGVNDPDGTVLRVEFYRGTVSDGTRLGTVEANGLWVLTGVSTDGWQPGEHALWARAQDNDGAWSDEVSTTVTIENAAPVIDELAASPDPVTRPGHLTLTAEGVNDPDGTVLRVEFYRDTVSDETRLGTVEANGPWTLSEVSTAGWALGQHTLLARAQDDDGAWSEAVSAVVTVQNAVPVIESLSISPNPVTRPGELTLTADGVHDPDGRVVLVEFYQGIVSEDTRLGAVEADGPWVLTSVSTDGWQPGEHALWARAQDNDGAGSEAISTPVQVENALPSIGALLATSDPVNRRDEITLTAEGVHDPDGNVVLVEFHRGTVSEATLLGSVEADGPWTVTAVVGADWDLGENTLVARARDNDGAWSPIVSTSVSVASVRPVIDELVADPDPLTRPALLTIAATGVGDADGQVTQVAFYRDGEWLGDGTSGSEGWSLNVSTAGWELGEHTLFAEVLDNDGAWSPMVSASVRVYAGLEPVDFGGVPVLVMQARTLNVHNDGPGPLLVEGSGLGLPFAIRPAHDSGDGDDWIVPSGATKAFIVSYLPIEDGWHQATLTMIGDADGRVVQISGWAASGWQNPVNPFDINGDGYVTPQDVLLLINEINRNGGGTLPLRTAQQPGPPYFFDPNGDGDLTPYDVLQVINFINRGESEQEPSVDAGEGELDGNDCGWLAALDRSSSFVPASVQNSATTPGLHADQRVNWLTAAVDDLAYRTTHRQPELPLELATWQRPGAEVWQPDDSDLPDWETLLDDPATDLADLDAYFAALG